MDKVHVTYAVEGELEFEVPPGATEADRAGLIAAAVERDAVKNLGKKGRISTTVVIIPGEEK